VYNVNWVVPPAWYIPQKWWGHVPPSSYGGAALERTSLVVTQIPICVAAGDVRNDTQSAGKGVITSAKEVMFLPVFVC